MSGRGRPNGFAIRSPAPTVSIDAARRETTTSTFADTAASELRGADETMATTASRKARGAQTQRLVAAYLAANGWPFATDAGGGRDGVDILGVPGLSIEVKARAGLNPLAWMREAQSRPGLPLVVFRPNGAGPATIAAWPALIGLHDLTTLLRAAGYGDP